MPTILVHPLFNTTLGYRDYIFPAVANIILQQTLLLACARLMAERQRRRERRMSVAAALGMWAACTLVGVLSALLYFGMIYCIQDIPHAGALPALLVAVPVFAATVAALGLLLGKLFNSGDDALKILLPTSVPLVFLAGFAWPLHAMPGWLSALAWFSHATCDMHIFVPLNQMDWEPFPPPIRHVYGSIMQRKNSNGHLPKTTKRPQKYPALHGILRVRPWMWRRV